MGEEGGRDGERKVGGGGRGRWGGRSGGREREERHTCNAILESK